MVPEIIYWGDLISKYLICQATQQSTSLALSLRGGSPSSWPSSPATTGRVSLANLSTSGLKTSFNLCRLSISFEANRPQQKRVKTFSGTTAPTPNTLVSVRCRCSDGLSAAGSCLLSCSSLGQSSLETHAGRSVQCTAASSWLGALRPTLVSK